MSTGYTLRKRTAEESSAGVARAGGGTANEENDGGESVSKAPPAKRGRPPRTKTPPTEAAAAKKPRSQAANRRQSSQESKRRVNDVTANDVVKQFSLEEDILSIRYQLNAKCNRTVASMLKAIRTTLGIPDGTENKKWLVDIDVSALHSPGGNVEENNVERVKVYIELKKKHPVQWKHFMIDGKNAIVNLDKWVFANNKEKRDMCIYRLEGKGKSAGKSAKSAGHTGGKVASSSHASDMAAGNTAYLGESIKQAIPAMSMASGFILSNIPVHLSVVMAQMYGDCEEGGYTHKFMKHAPNIHFSKDDGKYYKQYLEEETKIRGTRGAKKIKTPKPQDPSCAEDSVGLFSKSIAIAEFEEDLMTGGKIGDVNAIEENENSDSIKEEEEDMKEWVESDNTKKGGNEMREEHPDSFTPYYAQGGEKRRRAWNDLAVFYAELGLKAKFMTNQRAMYMMDAAFLQTHTKIGKPGDPTEPDDMHKADLVSADSDLHSKLGRNATLMMTDLITRAVQAAVSYKIEEGRQEAEGLEVHQKLPSLDELLNTKAKCVLNTGIIRQGAHPIHQSLHLDNANLLDDDTVKRFYSGEELTPQEWLKLGFVIDMPLSKEGLWIRVAPPCAKERVFSMHWVYVPYGSMLIRSMALLHSGHYGSPGNCRYHGTFTVAHTDLDTKHLGFLTQMTKGRVCDFSDWSLEWSPNIPEEGRSADGYRHLVCKEWTKAKGNGQSYYNKYVKCLLNVFDIGKNILKNLNPYVGLEIQPRVRVKFDLNDRSFERQKREEQEEAETDEARLVRLKNVTQAFREKKKREAEMKQTNSVSPEDDENMDDIDDVGDENNNEYGEDHDVGDENNNDYGEDHDNDGQETNNNNNGDDQSIGDEDGQLAKNIAIYQSGKGIV